MGRVREGGKAGLLAGFVYAGLEAAAVVTLLLAFRSSILDVVRSEFPSGTNVDAAYSALVGIDAVVAVAFGIIAGLVLGLVYGAVSEHIPGQRGVTKGLLFGLVLWGFLHVLADYVENLKYGVNFYLADIGLGLATSLVFGTLLGVLFDRAMGRLPAPGPKSRAGEMGSTQGGPGSLVPGTPGVGSEGIAPVPASGSESGGPKT